MEMDYRDRFWPVLRREKRRRKKNEKVNENVCFNATLCTF